MMLERPTMVGRWRITACAPTAQASELSTLSSGSPYAPLPRRPDPMVAWERRRVRCER
jgi:hypothetical protein